MNPLEEDEGNAWPDEPDEFDPDSIGPDPPDSASTLEESFGATADVSDDLFRAFWASVLLLNVALASLSLGAMFVYFRGDYGTGGPALLVGTVAALATARYYWRFKTGRYAEPEADGADGDDGDTDGSRRDDGSGTTDDPAAATSSGATDSSEAEVRTETERGPR